MILFFFKLDCYISRLTAARSALGLPIPPLVAFALPEQMMDNPVPIEDHDR